MLRWALANGEAYNAALKRADEDGSDIPDDLQPPDFLDGIGIWYGDFWRLSTERQIGMAEGEIPASAIDRHTEGWPYEDAYMFESCMREMDQVYRQRGETKPPNEPAISLRDAFRGATANRRG